MDSSASAVAAGLPSYATLLNLKIVVQSSSSEYLAVDRHLFYDCMRGLLSHVKVDEGWYLGRYQDVREAIAQSLVSSAHEHYTRFGYYEHRMPCKIEVDESWYLNAYTDVQEAISRKLFQSGQHHFEVSGFEEGRLPFPNFSLSAPNLGATNVGPTNIGAADMRRPPMSKVALNRAT